MSWEKVIASVPVDRVAVWVTLFKAWDGPTSSEDSNDLPVRAPGDAPAHVLASLEAEEKAKRRWAYLVRRSPHNLKRNPPKPDLTGRVFGHLLVIGAATNPPERTKTSRKKGCLWVCACSCGAYVLRRRKSIEAGNGGGCGHGCDSEAAIKVDCTVRGRTIPRWKVEERA